MSSPPSGRMSNESDSRKGRVRRLVLDGTTILASVCALGMLGSALLDSHQAPGARSGWLWEERLVSNWAELAATGNRVGPQSARVEIVTFVDYRCPFCSKLEGPLEFVRDTFPRDVAVVYRQLPLLTEVSYQLARFAECAAQQNQFWAVHEILYGIPAVRNLDPQVISQVAGLSDPARFELCANNTDPDPAIERDLKVADEVGITAVPGVIFEGTLLSIPPDSATLLGLVRSRLEVTDG